jgi:ribonucleotide reductase alpha subunit
MQDHLYKEHVAMEKDHAKIVEELKAKTADAEENLKLEQMKVEKLEASLQAIQSKEGEEVKSRVIELTKQNALLEINLVRLTRKYQTLEQ